jgi:hypothetical protein
MAFANLSERHEYPWMNWRVMSMNLQLVQAVMGYVVSHFGVPNTAYTVKEEYSTHDLHLISQSKKRLTHLTACTVVDDCATCVSSMPVIIHASASPFLG